MEYQALSQGLWSHQQKLVDRAFETAQAIFHEPRLGKTRTICRQIRRLELDRVLIVCPKTVASVWMEEARIGGLPATDLSDGKLSERVLPKAGLVVTNYDAVSYLLPWLLNWKPQMVVADESHKIKNHTAKRSKALHKLGRVAQYRRILSGTPDPQSYFDYFSQYKFLAPDIFGEKVTPFREAYCIHHHIWKSKIVGYHNLDSLRLKLFSVADRLRRVDATSVPPVQDVIRRVDLPASAKDLYARLTTEFLSEQPRIDATHALTRMLRLQQITAGFVEIDGQEKFKHDAKIQAVVGELEGFDKKAVVFYRFKAEGKAIKEALNKEFGEGTAEQIGGDTPGEHRQSILSRFDRDALPRVLVAQEALAEGVSMKAANLAIFTTCSFNYAAHVQARDRIWDDKNPLVYVYLVVPGTIDETVMKAISKKQSASEMMLDIGFARSVYGNVEDEVRGE